MLDFYDEIYSELIVPFWNLQKRQFYHQIFYCKVGIAGGATRASITHHQAKQGNMAEISAKDGTQETVVNLIASFTSLYLLGKILNPMWVIKLDKHFHYQYQFPGTNCHSFLSWWSYIYISILKLSLV